MELNKNSKNYTLHVKIIQGVEIDKSKTLDQASSYVIVQYGDVTKQTATIANTANPTWLQILSFNLTPVRKLKINVFYRGSYREKRIGKIKQEFDISKQEEITYTQKLTRGKLIYSIKVEQESTIPIHATQPVIPPNPENYSDSESSEVELIDEVEPDPPQAESALPGQRIFEALKPASPGDLLKSLAETLAPRVRPAKTTGGGWRGALGDAIGTAIAQACLNIFCLLILIVFIIFSVIYVLITRYKDKEIKEFFDKLPGGRPKNIQLWIKE